MINPSYTPPSSPAAELFTESEDSRKNTEAGTASSNSNTSDDQDTIKSDGYLRIESENINKSIDAIGPVSLSSLKMHGNIKAERQINIRHSTVEGNITSDDDVTLDWSTLKGSVLSSYKIVMHKSTASNVTSAGQIDLNESSVTGVLRTNGCFVRIDKKSTVKNIVIEPVDPNLPSSSTPFKQTVEIDGKSKVEHITFESGDGEVIIKNGASVTGEVSGGKIKYVPNTHSHHGFYAYTGLFREPKLTQRDIRLQSIARELGYTLTGDGKKDTKRMLLLAHPDKGGSLELTQQLTDIFNKHYKK